MCWKGGAERGLWYCGLQVGLWIQNDLFQIRPLKKAKVKKRQTLYVPGASLHTRATARLQKLSYGNSVVDSDLH
jgi:hypothetical protein